MSYTVKADTAKRKENKLTPGRFNRPQANKCLLSTCVCTIEDVDEIEIEFFTLICRTDTVEEIQTKVDAAAEAELVNYN